VKIAVPSYVTPGSYLENASFLEDKRQISGIELLFFLYDEETRLLFEKEAAGIGSLKGRFSYTLHLPDILLPEHEELLTLTCDLVDHYIVHPPRFGEVPNRGAHKRGAPSGKAPGLDTFLPGWRDRYGDIFLLENTRYDLFEAALSRLPDIPVCCDTGHLLLEQRSPARFFETFEDRIRQVHLHNLGLDQEDRLPDHRPLQKGESWLEEMLPWLESFTGPVELELFSWDEIETSLSVLEHYGLL